MRAAARIVHYFDARTERVTLRVRPSGSAIADDFELTFSQARRLAWGLLADLCPDEVDQDLERALDCASALRPSSTAFHSCSCRCATQRPPSGKAAVLLHCMTSGPLTARRAGELTDCDTSTASAFLIHLVRKQLAERISGGMFGEPTVYGLTAQGRAAVGEGMIF